MEYAGVPGADYNWNPYSTLLGGIAPPSSSPDLGDAGKGDVSSQPNIGATHSMLPVFSNYDSKKLKADETELTEREKYSIHEYNKKASFWGVGGIATDFLNAADPEKAFMQLAIDTIFYMPNVVVKWLQTQQTLQEKRNEALKQEIKEEQADWLQRRKEIAKMFAGSDEKATYFLHKDFINAKGDLNVMAANLAKENPNLLAQAKINISEDGTYNLTPEQQKQLKWVALAYRSTQLHGSAPRQHEVESYVKQADWFLANGCYPRMYDEQQKRNLSEQQKQAEENYVKDKAQRQDALRNLAGPRGLPDAWYTAHIYQDLVRNKGDLSSLVKEVNDPNNPEFEKERHTLELLQKLRLPPRDENLSPAEKAQLDLAEQQFKRQTVEQIIKDNPALAKIVPNLAKTFEEIPGTYDPTTGTSTLNQEGVDNVILQMVLAKRAYEAYEGKHVPDALDMKIYNEQIGQLAQADYFQGHGKDFAAFMAFHDNPATLEQIRENQEKIKRGMGKVGAKTIGTIRNGLEDLAALTVEQGEEIKQEVKRQGELGRKETDAQAKQTREEVRDQSDKTRKTEEQQAALTRDQVKYQGNLDRQEIDAQAKQTREEVRDQGNKIRETEEKQAALTRAEERRQGELSRTEISTTAKMTREEVEQGVEQVEGDIKKEAKLIKTYDKRMANSVKKEIGAQADSIREGAITIAPGMNLRNVTDTLASAKKELSPEGLDVLRRFATLSQEEQTVLRGKAVLNALLGKQEEQTPSGYPRGTILDKNGRPMEI